MLTSQYEGHRRHSGAFSRFFVLAVAIIMLAAVALFPHKAAAQPISLADLTLEVQLMPEVQPGTNGLVVGVRLPAGTALPVTVRLPLPEGANVFWAGEITGGPMEQDIQREFTIVEGVGGQAVEFTAETTTTVQYDAMYGSVGIAGNEARTTLAWRQTVDTGAISIGIRLPPGTELVEPDPPAPPVMNAAGESLYSLRPFGLEPGAETSIAVTYRAAAGAGAGTAQSPVRYLIFMGLGIAIVGLVLAVLGQRKRQMST